MVRDVQQRQGDGLSYVRESIASTVDPEDGYLVGSRGGGTRSVASERLARVSRGSELHDGIRSRSAFSEWLENASLTDGLPTDQADDVVDGGRVPCSLLQRGEGNDPMFPLYGQSGGPEELLLERGPDYGTRRAKRIRTSEATGTRETERLRRYQAEVNRRDKYVRRNTRRALWHVRRARELFEEIQWSIDPTESEISETDRA